MHDSAQPRTKIRETEPLANDVERQLVQRLVARDVTAWASFVNSYQGFVAQQLRFHGGRLGIAMTVTQQDDLLAELFSRLLENDMAALRSFQFGCTLRTWLAVIARRVCLRQLRRQSREQAISAAARDRLTAVSSEPSRALDRDAWTLVESKLDQLKPTDRQILELFFLEGLDYQQIAERTGLSLNSVGPKLHRARQRLKKLLRFT